MPGPVRLVACVNQRLGSGQRSCAGSGSLDLIRQIETEIEARGLEIGVVRRECLGKCEQGPAMRIAPGGPFFFEIDSAGLARIVDEHERFAASQHDQTT